MTPSPALPEAAGSALRPPLPPPSPSEPATLLALSAHMVGALDAARVGSAVRLRWRRRPLSFFWPAKEAPADHRDNGAKKG